MVQVLGLVLSDVIGDPLDVIASGPTVPQTPDPATALQILDKYGLTTDKHSSVRKYLGSAPPPCSEVSETHDCFNMVIGSNKMAAAAAKEAAIALGYTSFMWSRRVQGEAAFLGKVYAAITHYAVLKQHGGGVTCAELEKARDGLYNRLSELSQLCPTLSDDVSNLVRVLEEVVVVESGQPFCLVGAGEPTVRVTGRGRGGRNQELALSYALELHQLLGSGEGSLGEEGAARGCVLACVGTDGQDGPCGDAAGAMVDLQVTPQVQEQGLEPAQSLQDNDSHTFFTKLNSGKNLIKTGLTGTNVMDIHVLLVR